MPERRTRIAAAILATLAFVSDVGVSHGQSVPSVRIVETGSEADLFLPFDSLDPEAITSGFLLDRSRPILEPEGFSGLSEAQPSTAASWRQLVHQFSRSAVASNNQDIPNRTAINAAIELEVERGLIPIGILFARYQRLEDHALEDGTIELIDGKLQLVEGEDPFQTATVVAAAVGRGRAYGLQQLFVVPSALVVAGDGLRPKSIEIDFGDGAGFRSVSPGSPTAVNYATPGTKEIRARVVVDDVYFAFATLDIEEETPTPDRVWADQVAARPYLGGYSRFDLYGYLGNGNAGLSRPILFVDGFDPLHFDPTLRRTWQDNYRILSGAGFLDALLAHGYDAVVMKLKNTTEHVQQSAFGLESTISILNADKLTSEPLVIIGPSMGGLLARYALAFMERQGLDHQTRLFITLDAPHNGGNIPLGDQYFFEFFDTDSDLAAVATTGLNSPAARQLMVYHYESFPQEDPLRTEFRQDYDEMGYPSIPGVAVADGSGFGFAQTGNERSGFRRMLPGDKIVEYRYRSLLVDLDGDVWALPDHSPETQIFEGMKDVIGPHHRSLDVYVSNTMPLDNAPGGNRATQNDIASGTVDQGNIETSFPEHSWIMTTSSLDLDTDDVFYSVTGDPDGLIQFDNGKQRTAHWDQIYYPIDNREHVKPYDEGVEFLLRTIDADMSRQKVFVSPIVLLEGAFRDTCLTTALNELGRLPLTQPFAGPPWNYDGVERVPADFFSNRPQIVDWVLLQLRTNAADSATTVGTTVAFIRSDGRIVGKAGTGGVGFDAVVEGDYHVVVRHRNHLPVVSAQAVSLSIVPTVYDFTLSADATMNSSALTALPDGRYGLRSADADGDGEVTNRDKNFVWAIQVGSAGYRSGDFNLDGNVRNDDKNDYWAPNVGKGSGID